jgi:hypothetical protein
MRKTAAQRQADYRARRPLEGKDGNGQRRLNLWVDTRAHLALSRLAARYCVTKREMIERVILAEDERILATIEMPSQEWDTYFNAPGRYCVTAIEKQENGAKMMLATDPEKR